MSPPNISRLRTFSKMTGNQEWTLFTLQSIRWWNYTVSRHIFIWVIKGFISPWELKWHSVGAAEQVIHSEAPIKMIIIHCPAIFSLSVTCCLYHSVFIPPFIPPILMWARGTQRWEGEPSACFFLVGGGGWRGKKAVAWHHSLCFSSDLPFSAPLGMTLKNKILTFKMTKSEGRRVRWEQEERWERRQERRRESDGHWLPCLCTSYTITSTLLGC